MKKVMIIAASALCFLTAGYSVFFSSTSNAAPIGPTTTDCLPGYQLTMRINIYVYGTSVKIDSYIKGFHSSADLWTYVSNYNAGNTTTIMGFEEICRMAPGPFL